MEHLLPERCALVVVDVQNDFCHPEGAFSLVGHDTSTARAVLDPIERLHDQAHTVEVPVILVRVAHSPWTDDPTWRDRFLGLPEDRRPKGPVVAEGTWGREFYGLEPDARDLVITKHRYSAFSHTPLPLVLRAVGASTLVITGVQTEVCVLSTARDALDHGILPVVVSDAVATTDPAAHDAALESVRVRMGPVVETEDIIEEVEPNMTDDVVWTMAESDRAAAVTARFMAENGIDSYQALVQRSVEDPEWFWAEVVDFLGIPFQRPASQVVDVSDGIEWSRWFVDGAVNVSEVCIDRWAAVAPERPAVIVESEDGDTSEHSYADLLNLVEQAASAFRELGAQPGDRIASYLPMGLDAVVVLLATARIGAIVVPVFSGFGAPAVASRLNDSEARIMVCAESYQRRGRPVDMKAVADDAAAPSPHLEHLVVVGGGESAGDRDRSWSELLRTAPTGEDAGASIDTPSETPFMLAYTSGTTGRPKGVVHVHGGFTVKIAQEAAFQTDIQPGDRVTWLTDMGWIMGPWITLGALANGATLVLYDGAPDHPDPGRVWRFAEGQQLTFLGLSPTLARSLGSTAPTAHDGVDLSALRAFGSTGEAWNEGPWWWLFDDVGGRDIPIVNLSGGTEVGACFLSVNLLQGLKPVSVGGPALGMDVDVIDASGQTVLDGLGELACRSPWPGMTRGVWNDPQRYLETYWSRVPGVWVHGDWASRDADGFWYLHGRSDDTLNIAGKRIGPAEFESVAVSVPGVVAAAAVGVPDPVKGESSVLCVVAGPNPPDDLVEQVSAAVVRELGKAFKPSAVHVVDDLPRTRSAKIVRRAVKAVLLGDDPGDVSTLENPESLGALPGSPSPEEGPDR